LVTCAITASNVAGSSSATSGAVGPVIDLAPVNTIAPVLSGTATVGQTLGVTNGTWTNPPTGYSYDWRRNGISIGATSQNTYSLASADNGTNISCVVTATNSGGSGSATSNTLGPVGTVSLATPALALQSASGTSPVTLQWSDTDYVAGYYGQLQIDQTSNAFGAVTQNIIFFIDGTSWALNDESINLTSPSGTYYARIRVCRENEAGATSVTGTDPAGNSVTFNADVSSWSNIVTDTIGSVAQLNTTTGANKTAALTDTAFTFSGVSTNGNCSARSTVQQGFNKAQFEITITSGAATGSTVVGIEDGTTNFNTTHGMPGLDGLSGTGSGIAVAFYNSGATISLFYNAGANQVDFVPNTAGTIANNDTFTIVYDEVGNTIEVWRTRAGTTTQMGTTKTGLPSLSAHWAYCGTRSSTSAGTMNFGGTTYAKSPGTGVSSFWA
jgi:hypothetical protein